MQMTLQRQKFIAAEEKYRMNGLSQIMVNDSMFSIDGEKEIGQTYLMVCIQPSNTLPALSSSDVIVFIMAINIGLQFYADDIADIEIHYS